MQIFRRKGFLKEACMPHLNAHNVKTKWGLLENTQYSSPSSMHPFRENNSDMRDVALVSLCFCHIPVLLLATLLAGFPPQTVLRPSPAKSESSPEMEVEAVSSRAVLQFMLLCLKMNVEAFSEAVYACKEYLCFISPHTSRKFSHYLSTKDRLCNTSFLSPMDGSLSSLLIFHTLLSPAFFVPIWWIFTPNTES